MKEFKIGMNEKLDMLKFKNLGEERDAYSVEMFLDFALILQVNGRKVGVDGFFY